MSGDEQDGPATNREKKVQSRSRRRRYVQGTRSYLHALTNSMARRGEEASDERSGKKQ